jgi:hypothetical protein
MKDSGTINARPQHFLTMMLLTVIDQLALDCLLKTVSLVTSNKCNMRFRRNVDVLFTNGTKNRIQNKGRLNFWNQRIKLTPIMKEDSSLCIIFDTPRGVKNIHERRHVEMFEDCCCCKFLYENRGYLILFMLNY